MPPNNPLVAADAAQSAAPLNSNIVRQIPHAIVDWQVVRQHAAEWGLSPDRIGFIGFSAGAMVTSGALLQKDAGARPNFGAMIYGGPFGEMPAIPAKLPPMFLAWAQDDPLVLEPIVKFYSALKSAGQKPEVHIVGPGRGWRPSQLDSMIAVIPSAVPWLLLFDGRDASTPHMVFRREPPRPAFVAGSFATPDKGIVTDIVKRPSQRRAILGPSLENNTISYRSAR